MDAYDVHSSPTSTACAFIAMTMPLNFTSEFTLLILSALHESPSGLHLSKHVPVEVIHRIGTAAATAEWASHTAHSIRQVAPSPRHGQFTQAEE